MSGNHLGAMLRTNIAMNSRGATETAVYNASEAARLEARFEFFGQELETLKRNLSMQICAGVKEPRVTYNQAGSKDPKDAFLDVALMRVCLSAIARNDVAAGSEKLAVAWEAFTEWAEGNGLSVRLKYDCDWGIEKATVLLRPSQASE